MENEWRTNWQTSAMNQPPFKATKVVDTAASSVRFRLFKSSMWQQSITVNGLIDFASLMGLWLQVVQQVLYTFSNLWMFLSRLRIDYIVFNWCLSNDASSNWNRWWYFHNRIACKYYSYKFWFLSPFDRSVYLCLLDALKCYSRDRSLHRFFIKHYRHHTSA